MLSHQALKSDILFQSYSLLKNKNSEREKLRNEATNIFVHASHNGSLGETCASFILFLCHVSRKGKHILTQGVYCNPVLFIIKKDLG